MDSETLLNTKVFKHVCRTCLKTEKLFSINDIEWEGLSLRNLIGKWIFLESRHEHKMPQKICKSCIKWIFGTEYFARKIKNVDQLLQKSVIQERSHVNVLLETKNEPIVVKLENEIIEIRLPNPDKQEHDFDSDSKSFYDDTSFDVDNSLNDSMENTEEKIKNRTRVIELMKRDDEESSVIKEIKKEKLEIEALRKVVTETHRFTKLQLDHVKQGKVANELYNKALIYFCGVCQVGFNTHLDLRSHKKMANHHKGGASFYICPFCKKKLNLHTQLKEHLVKHKNEKPNLCSLCGKGFTGKSDLCRHVRNVHLNKRSQKCKFCYKLFSKTEKRKEHEATHANISYVCSVCGKEFKVYQYWASHERYHRKDVMRKKYEYKVYKREFQCSDCGKVYYTKQGFDEHVREHAGLKYSCDVCKKEFPTDLKMKKHKDFAHTEGKFVCDICGHTVKQKNILQNHIKNYHKGEKTEYKCEYCEKVFYNKNSHKLHTRIHTNDTKYQCKICFKICTTKRNLDTHMRVHTGERPHECQHCGRRFAAKENLSVHLKSHTGPPTCQCDICPRAFYTNGVLQKHIRNVHKKILEKTNAKSKNSATASVLASEFVDINEKW